MHLLDKPKVDISYDQILDYLYYDYEEGFSETEFFIVLFIIHVLCGGFETTKNLDEILVKKLLNYISHYSLHELVKSVVEDERKLLLEDIYQSGLISQQTKDNINLK